MFIFGKLVPALCLRAVIPVQMARRGGAGDARYRGPADLARWGPNWPITHCAPVLHAGASLIICGMHIMCADSRHKIFSAPPAYMHIEKSHMGVFIYVGI